MEFLSRFESNQVHIFGFSESHLQNDLDLNGELEVSRYILHRSGLTGGGGVAVYIKDTHVDTEGMTLR